MFMHGNHGLQDQIEAWTYKPNYDYTDAALEYTADPKYFEYDSQMGDDHFMNDLAFFDAHFEVRHIGLTMEQIREFNPPPNPAKITDPRAKDYVRQFGQVSWEVDALRPQVMEQIVTDGINSVLDIDVYAEIQKKEAMDKAKIMGIVNNLKTEDDEE